MSHFLTQDQRDQIIVVTADLSAARANFATPRPAILRPGGGGVTLDGGSLIVVGIRGVVNADAAGEGFVLNHIFNGTTTPFFRVAAQTAVSVPFSYDFWRPCSSPTIVADAAVNGGRLALALVGTPVNTSWLQVEMIEVNRMKGGFHSALGVDYAG